MAKYRNTDSEEHLLTNERIMKWLRKNLSPVNWIIELTGGEPALYKGIFDLVQELTIEGFRGLIKTNGLLPTPKSENFIRCAAFHQLNNFPKYWDKILIVDKLDSEEKIKYCKDRNIPYEVIGYNKEDFDGARHGFKRIAYIDPHGHQVPCPSCPIRYEDQPDKYTIEYNSLEAGHACSFCKAAVDAWRFLPDEWRYHKSKPPVSVSK